MAIASFFLVQAGSAAAQSQYVPPAPTGGYVMANGQRTANYEAALASWRQDKQFSVDYTKGYLGLEYAYVLGLSGKGQTIGINDAGVVMSHPSFAGSGKISGLRTPVPVTYGNDGMVNPRRPWEIHGTHVAGTAAGDRLANGVMFGNAFGANILSATTNFSAGDFLWWRDQILDNVTVATAQENIPALANTGRVRIINNSWGSTSTQPYTLTPSQARGAFQQTLNGFYDPVLKNDVLVVFSAGNGSGVHASIDAVTPLNDLRLRSNWLSVTNYLANGTAAASTSLCGQTATWCVSGPGSAVVSAAPTYLVDGTAIRAKYTRAMYPTIYAATTLAQLQTAAVNTWLSVLNDYIVRRDTALTQGRPFDEEAERTKVAQQAVGISLAYGARFMTPDPDGYTSRLAQILTIPGNVTLLGRDFSTSVLTQANTIITAELQKYITFTGPGYAALTGTSMAAPNVSGFASLLMEYFPEYKTGLISDILVSSSKDLDTPGVDLRSGWGAPQMAVALRGPTALRDTREVTVASGTTDIWSNPITDARDRYSAEVLAGFPNDIGGLVKRGDGELILTAANSYSGPTRVEQGQLTVDGSLTRSAVTAVSGGTIAGNGSVASLTAGTGGIVSPGSTGAFGTLTVAGTASLGSGSQFVADIGPAGTSDQLAARSIVLGGGNLTLRPVNYVPRYGDSYTLLTASNGIAGSFGSTTAFSAILYPELSYGAGRVTAAVGARPYTGVVAATPVQTAYARLLDANRSAYANLRGTYDLLDLQDVGTIRASLEAIAPRSQTTRQAIGTTATDNIARFYRDRLTAMTPDGFAGGTVAMIGKPLEFAANAIVAPGRPQTVSDTPTSMVRENMLPDNVSAYLAGGYIDGAGAAMPGTIGGRDPFDGFYIAGGVEARVSDTGALGFGLSYSDIDGDQRFGQSAKGELIQGTLYGRLGATLGPALDVQFGAGVYQSSTRRQGSFVGTPFDLRSRDNALALSSEVGASYMKGSGALRFGPRVAIRTSSIDFTPTGETGSGPALTYGRDRFLSVQGRAGLQVDATQGGFRPFASAYYVHDFEGRPGYFNAGFVGGTRAQARFLTAQQDRDWGEISAGVAYRSGRATVSLAADSTVGRDDVRNQSYRAGLKLSF